MRSNVTVGPPIDLLIYTKNAFEITRHRRLVGVRPRSERDPRILGAVAAASGRGSCRKFISTSRIEYSRLPASGGRGPVVKVSDVMHRSC